MEFCKSPSGEIDINKVKQVIIWVLCNQPKLLVEAAVDWLEPERKLLS